MGQRLIGWWYDCFAGQLCVCAFWRFSIQEQEHDRHALHVCG